jgi:hypothetical protein
MWGSYPRKLFVVVLALANLFGVLSFTFFIINTRKADLITQVIFTAVGGIFAWALPLLVVLLIGGFVLDISNLQSLKSFLASGGVFPWHDTESDLPYEAMNISFSDNIYVIVTTILQGAALLGSMTIVLMMSPLGFTGYLGVFAIAGTAVVLLDVLAYRLADRVEFLADGNGPSIDDFRTVVAIALGQRSSAVEQIAATTDPLHVERIRADRKRRWPFLVLFVGLPLYALVELIATRPAFGAVASLVILPFAAMAFHSGKMTTVVTTDGITVCGGTLQIPGIAAARAEIPIEDVESYRRVKTPLSPLRSTPPYFWTRPQFTVPGVKRGVVLEYGETPLFVGSRDAKDLEEAVHGSLVMHRPSSQVQQ